MSQTTKTFKNGNSSFEYAKDATATTKWVIDPLHSEVMFKVKHLVISTVTGSFSKFEGTAVTTGDSFENADINFVIDVNSIYTGQEQRDVHLKNGDFFEAETFPKITFQSDFFYKNRGRELCSERQSYFERSNERNNPDMRNTVAWKKIIMAIRKLVLK